MLMIREIYITYLKNLRLTLIIAHCFQQFHEYFETISTADDAKNVISQK